MIPWARRRRTGATLVLLGGSLLRQASLHSEASSLERRFRAGEPSAEDP